LSWLFSNHGSPDLPEVSTNEIGRSKQFSELYRVASGKLKFGILKKSEMIIALLYLSQNWTYNVVWRISLKPKKTLKPQGDFVCEKAKSLLANPSTA
jgi:hypothetical protein